MVDAVTKNVAAEMAEYASFSTASRIYIGMVLDCVLERGAWRDRWRGRISPRVADHAFSNMAVQRELRKRLRRFWVTREGDAEFTPLVMTSSWDIASADLEHFAPYRFLYERLYGPEVRPLLPSAFAAAVLLPQHPVDRRMALLGTLTFAAVSSCNEPIVPTFYPDGDAFEQPG